MTRDRASAAEGDALASGGSRPLGDSHMRRWAMAVSLAWAVLGGHAGACARSPQSDSGSDERGADMQPHGEGGHAAAPDAATNSGEHGAPEPTRQRVQISSERQQLIGVRTAVIERRALELSIRTVGVLAYDETRVTQIHTKFPGWVEQLYVDYVGKPVKRGQPLFAIYSPELVSAQVEYLLGVRQQQRRQERQDEAGSRAGGFAGSLAGAARQRLKLWDISDAQIDRLERTGQPQRTLTLYSPFDGVVLERNAYAGQYITPDTTAFLIGDLATIWVIAALFEYELRQIEVGQEAEVLFPYGQKLRPLKGAVAFIYPDIEPQTRRVRVRLDFANPGAAFKPDTFVTVTIRSSLGVQLAVPKDAVIDTGARQYALIALPDGYFEARDIQVGPPADDYYPVESGLEAGDRVVTSAQFLIDSETNLQAALKAMSGMPGMEGMEMPEEEPGEAPAPPGGEPR